jgi:type I restriction enzyme S subunit
MPAGELREDETRAYLINTALAKAGWRIADRTMVGQEIPVTGYDPTLWEGVRGLRIPLPPLPLQLRFADLVASHERLRAVQREALRQAEHLFQTLLHQAFGEGT